MFLELPIISFSELVRLKPHLEVEFSARSTRWSGQLQRALMPTWEGKWKQGLNLQLSTATSTRINLSCFWNHTLKLATPKEFFLLHTNLVSTIAYQNFNGVCVWKSMSYCAMAIDIKSKNEVFFLNLIQ